MFFRLPDTLMIGTVVPMVDVIVSVLQMIPPPPVNCFKVIVVLSALRD